MTIFPSPPSPHPLPPLGLSVTETVLETNLNSLFVPLSTYPVIGSHLLLFRKDWVSVGGPPSVLCILEDVCAPASSGAPLPCSDHGSLKAGSNQGSGQGGGVAVQGRHLSGFNDFPRPSFLHLGCSEERQCVALYYLPEVAKQGVLGSASLPDGFDLKDAYFHVKVNQRFWRFLQFRWRGRLYEYLVLPFGLCLAPLVFTHMTKPLQAFLHTKRVRCIFYLDNILIIGSLKEECLANLKMTLCLLTKVVFVVTYKKLSLVLVQHFPFLGFN